MSELIRISESNNWTVDYDKERGMYRATCFPVDEHWFDAYEEKEVNDDYIKELRHRIANEVEIKMMYMSACPNEMDTYLHIIAPDSYPPSKEPHCDTDCPYHYCVSHKQHTMPIKRFTDPPIREDAWWAGYCPRCGVMLQFSYADPDEANKKQYCWHCGQLVDFNLII